MTATGEIDFANLPAPSKMRLHGGNIPTIPQDKLCPHCPAKFTRSTHLNRHLKTHLGERQHHCDKCGAQFTRKDLLTRHQRNCDSSGNRSRRKSCRACAEAKQRCDTERPCSRCSARGKECVYIEDIVNNRNIPQTTTPATTTTTTAQTIRSVNSTPTFMQPHASPSEDSSSRGPASVRADTDEFANDISVFDFAHPQDPSLLANPINQQRSNDFFDKFLNNIFTCAAAQGRLPPALPEIEIPSANPADPYLAHPFQVTPEIDKIISSLVADPLMDQSFYAQAMNGDFSSRGLETKLDSVMVSGPSETELQYYLVLFFSSFVNQMPVVHRHTWALNRTPSLLSGAMQACGALYVKTRAANAFIASTLAQARDPLVAQFGKETATLSDRIYTILAVTLLQTLGLFHQHPEQRSTAMMYHSMLVAMIRRSGIMSEIAAWKIPDIDNVSDAAIEAAWKDWAVIEMGKRALCLAFLHDCSHCIYFSVKPTIFPSEFYVPLPCEDSLWNAQTSKDWLKALNKPSLYGARIDRLRGRTMGDCRCMFAEDNLNFHLSPLAHFLLIHAIIVKVHLLGVPKANSPHVNAPTDMAQVIASCKEVRDRVLYIQNALKLWLKSYQLCPDVVEYKDSTRVPFLHDSMPFYWIGQVSMIAFVKGFPPFGLISPLRGDEKYRLMKEWFKMIKVFMKSGQQDAAVFLDELMRIRLRNWQAEMQGNAAAEDQDGVLGFFPEF